MRAVQVMAPGRAEFIDMPVPQLRPGHALIRPQLLSLCGSDIYHLHYRSASSYPLPPGTTGHEMVGTVEAVDAAGSGIEVGMSALVLSPTSQAMVEWYLSPAEYVLPLPAGKPLEEMVQAQQLGTVLYAAKHLKTSVIGRTVAIIGQGSAGLYWAWLLRRMGARQVIAIDKEAHRLVLPREFGATHVINNTNANVKQEVADITKDEMADLVVEAAGELDAVQLTCDLVTKHGEILCFGIPHFQDLKINFSDFFRRYPCFQCISGAINDPGQGVTRHAIELIAQGIIDVKPLITHRFSFERVMDAYELHHTRGDNAVKIIVEVGGESRDEGR